MKKITIILLFLISFTSFASTEHYYKKQLGLWVEVHKELYSQQGKWIVEVFTRTENEMIRLESQKVFPDQLSAQKEFKINHGDAYLGLHFPKLETEVANQHLWKVENAWNLKWEDKFSQWIEDEVDLEFFRRYDLDVDCADVALTLRWIFARNHRLPMVTSQFGGSFLTHRTFLKSFIGKKRDPLWHKDQVFRSALRYLVNTSSTKTIMNDLYPVELSTQFVKPGAVYMVEGHSRLFKRVQVDGEHYPIEFMYGTVPASKNVYREYFFISNNKTSFEEGGILQFKWPVLNQQNLWRHQESESMPGYSLEQYSISTNKRFYTYLFEKLGIDLNPKKALNAIADNMIDLLIVRKNIVEQGLEVCSKNNCHKQSRLYDEWSTPSRDKRVAKLFGDLKSFSIQNKLVALWNQKLESTFLTIEDSKLSLWKLSKLFESKWVSGDPRDSIGIRWGMNDKYIKSHLENKIKSGLKRRSMRDSVCSSQSDNGCGYTGSRWQSSQLYNIDNQIHNDTHKLIDFCSYLERDFCHESRQLINQAISLNSDPLKMNQVSSYNSSQVLIPEFQKSLEQIESQLVLDNNTIFDLESSRVVYQKFNTLKLYSYGNNWVEIDHEVINLLSDNYDVLDSLQLPQASKVHHKQLGDKLIVSICSEVNQCSTTLYEITNLKMNKIKNFSSVSYPRKMSNGSGACFVSDTGIKECLYYNNEYRWIDLKSQANHILTKPIIINDNLIAALPSDKGTFIKSIISGHEIMISQVIGHHIGVEVIGDDKFLIQTSESVDNCHVVDISSGKVATTTCLRFAEPIVYNGFVYVQDSQKNWWQFKNDYWVNLGKHSSMVGMDENKEIVFFDQVSKTSFERLYCINHSIGLNAGCFGNSGHFYAKMDLNLNLIYVNQSDSSSNFMNTALIQKNNQTRRTIIIHSGRLTKYSDNGYYYTR